MSGSFDEGRLRFDFGDSWTVEKYDDHRDYRKKIGKLDGTRAIDFVGVLDERELFLIEVKDLRGFRIENKGRVEQGLLALEVAFKVRDTLSGLVAAHRRSSEPETWEPYVRTLSQPQRRLSVVLWLEEDRPAGKVRSQREAAARGTLTQILKKRLRWLTTKVAVVDRDGSHLPDLEVIYKGSS